METGQILYARYRDLIVLKFAGEIGYTSHWTFPLSAGLSSFIERLCAKKDFDNVVVDMTETTGIDSTNLGLLAQIAQFMIREFGRKATIITSQKNVTRLLRTVGFHTLFTLIDEHAPIRGGLEAIPPVDSAEVDVARMILDAHKSLAGISADNRLLFTSIIDAIEDDIAHRDPGTDTPK
ncbi:MAG: STAS domain-containing protein [Candidatus Hydrogenedentes bacterium]|nr:STAS domain-containing protein [Candidatus Hydrogenedentota bacterium]